MSPSVWIVSAPTGSGGRWMNVCPTAEMGERERRYALKLGWADVRVEPLHESPRAK